MQGPVTPDQLEAQLGRTSQAWEEWNHAANGVGGIIPALPRDITEVRLRRAVEEQAKYTLLLIERGPE